MEDVTELVKYLVEHGLGTAAVCIAALAVVVPHLKGVFEGLSGFIAEQRRVSIESRVANAAMDDAAERRRVRAADLPAPAPPKAQLALPSPSEPMFPLPAPKTRLKTAALPSESPEKATSKKRSR